MNEVVLSSIFHFIDTFWVCERTVMITLASFEKRCSKNLLRRRRKMKNKDVLWQKVKRCVITTCEILLGIGKPGIG